MSEQQATAESLSEQLEAMIDKQGVQCVLSAIEEICHDKAEHLESNWQDNASARVWTRMATAIGKAWSKAGDLGL